MSKVIDERVVEMRFDNSDFEKNVRTSMSTLEQLKQSLKIEDMSANIESVSKAVRSVDFDSISAGVESLQKRFSTLGIVGMRVIENLTDTGMNLIKKASSFLTSGIIQGGINRAMNLENAHFQLQGLLKDETAVEAVMKNVNDSVDGTAYSLDAAAKVASQFAASGMRAGDKMFQALRAVAGVAAMTNSEYSDVGMIFTTVAGNGRLMGDQLLQLSSRGLNAAATLAEYLTKTGNGAKVTEEKVREMVTKGKISFETFAAAMDYAFGEHAKKANETFSGSLSNIKAALGRIGALFISPLIVQNGPLVELLNTVRERINDIKTAVEPMAKTFTDTFAAMAKSITRFLTRMNAETRMDLLSNLVATVMNIASGIGSILKPIQLAFMEVFPSTAGASLLRFSEILKMLSAKLILNEKETERLRNTFKGLFSILDLGLYVIKSFLGGVTKLIEKTIGIRGGILGITSVLGIAISKITEFVKSTTIVEKVFGAITIVIQSVIHVMKAFVDLITSKISNINFEPLIRIFATIIELISAAGLKIKELFSAINSNSVKASINVFGAWVSKNELFSRIATNLVSIIKGVITKIKEWFSEFSKLPEVTSFIESFKEVARDALETVAEKLDIVVDKIKSLDKVTLSNIINQFKKLKDAILNKLFGKNDELTAIDAIVKGAFDESGEAVNSYESTFTSKFKGLSKGLTNYKDKAVKTFTSVASSIKNNITLGGILTSTLGGSLAYSMFKTGSLSDKIIATIKAPLDELGNLFKSVTAIAENFSKLLSSAGGTLLQFTNVLKSMQFNIRMGALLKLAGAVAILSGSIFLLSKIPNDGSMTRAVIAVVALAGVMTALAVAFNKLGASTTSWNWKDGFKSTNSALTGAAVAITLLASSLFIISKIDSTKIASSLITLGVMMAEIVVASAFLAKYVKAMPKMMGSLIGIALAVNMLAKAFKTIDSIDLNHMWKTLLTLGSLTGMLMGVMFVTGKMGNTKGAVGALALAVALNVLVSAFKNVETLDMNALWKNIGGLLAAVVTIMSLLVATSKAGKFADKGGLGILAMSAAILILTTAMKKIGKLDSLSISKSIGVISKLFLLFAAVTAASAFAGKYAIRAGAMIAIMAGALWTLSTAMLVLGVMDGAALKRATDAISQIMISFGIVVALSGIAAKLNAGAITSLAVTIGILTAAIGAIAMMPADKVKAAAASISAVLLAFAALEFGTKNFGTVNVKPILAMAGVVAILGGVLILLAKSEPQKAIGAATALSTLMLTFAGVMAVLKKTGSLVVGVIPTLYLMAGVVAILGTIITAMTKLTGSSDALMVSIGLSAVLLSMAGTLRLLTLGGPLNAINVGTAVKAALALGGFITVISGIMIALSELLVHVFKIKVEDLQKASAIFTVIGYMIGSLIGGAIGGIIGGASNALPAIGRKLTKFMENASGFFEGLEGIPEDATNKLATLTKVLLMLASAEYIRALTDVISIFGILNFDKQNESFGSKLADLGDGLSDFAKSTKDIGKYTDSMDAAVSALSSLIEMSKMLKREGGLLAMLTIGDRQSGLDFNWDIGWLADGIVDFAETTKGIDESTAKQINRATKALKALAELNAILPNFDGIVQVFTGQPNMEKFASGLAKLGLGLQLYTNLTKGITEDKAAAAARATAVAKSLAEVQNSVDSLSWVAKLTGRGSLTNFANGLESFGQGLIAFGDSVTGIEEYTTSIDAALSISRQLAGIVNSLPEGPNSMAIFANGITEFSKSFKTLNAEVQKSNPEKFISVATALDTLNASIANLDDANVSKIDKIKDSLNRLNEINYPTQNGKGKSNLLSGLTSDVDMSIAGLAKNIQNKSTSVTTTIRTMLTNAMNKAGKDSQSTFQNSGTSLINALNKAMENKKPDAKAKAKAIADAAGKSVATAKPSFTSSGNSLIDGLLTGMDQKSGSVLSKAASIAKKAAAAIKNALKIKSPSKVTMEFGERIDEGLIVGMQRLSKRVEAAAAGVAENTVDALADSLTILTNLELGDIEAEPVIRPVLDLSDVQNGTGRLNNMLDLNPLMSVTANTNAISSMMNRASYGATNDDVVLAINKLNDRLDRVGDIYNINGITYDDGTNISDAVRTLVRAAKIERRV